MAYDIATWVKVSAFVGSSLSMGLGAIGAAIGEGLTAAEANASISRSPDSSGEIFKTMLVGQAVAESAAIFSLVVAMMMLFTAYPTEHIMTAIVLFSAGMCMGFGAIGSGIGSGFPAAACCTGIARQPQVRDRMTTNMLIGSAICQTPAIFALVTALILLFTDFHLRAFAPTWAAVIGAGLAAGIGAMGSGIGEGLVASSGCEGVARQPSAAGRVTNIMLLGMAVTETTAIYGLLIAVILMFKTFEPAESLASSIALIGSGLCMGLGAIGPGIGEGFTAKSAVSWIARNEEETGTLTRSMLVGQAVSESTGIYSLVIALILIFVV